MDALRHALAAIPQAEGVTRLDGYLSESVTPLLDAPWILDIDTTIKPLYGKQEGAVVSYNPKKPGRPSHSYHTYLMAGLRLVVGAEVKAGNQHSGSHSLPGLMKILDELPANGKPKIVRGDCDFGSDRFMVALEERQQPYSIQAQATEERQTPHRAHFLARRLDRCRPGLGRQGRLSAAAWMGYRSACGGPASAVAGRDGDCQQDNGQGLLGFIEADRKTGKRTTGYEYAVLASNLDHEILSLGQLYRDRANAENAFDELKNRMRSFKDASQNVPMA